MCKWYYQHYTCGCYNYPTKIKCGHRLILEEKQEQDKKLGYPFTTAAMVSQLEERCKMVTENIVREVGIPCGKQECEEKAGKK
jgi:hypothetical protein